MTPETVIDLFRHAIFLMVIMVSVIVTPGLLMGLLVAMFQAATQINEMSMSFIPKLIVTLLMMAFSGPWLLKMILGYTRDLMMGVPSLIG